MTTIRWVQDKPRLFRAEGLWCCRGWYSGYRWVGWGGTPKDAYRAWRDHAHQSHA